MAAPVTLAQLPQVLQATTAANNEIRRASERALNQLQRLPGFLPQVLKLVGVGTTEQTVRYAAAIALRNSILSNRNWARKSNELYDDSHACFPDADKLFIKAHIIELCMSISLKPLISTLAEAIVEIVVHDFPTQWPAFMPSIQENLKRVGELARVHNVLFIVRKIAKRFEYHGKHRWDQMRAIIDPTAPSLYQMMDALLPNPSVEAAVLIKLIVKIFWSCTFHNIPAMMQDRTTAIAWFRLLNSLLSKPFGEPGSGTQPEQPADADDRAAWPWWKAKKWAAQVFQRQASKYCTLEGFAPDDKAERKFCKLFSKEIFVHLIPTQLQLLYGRKRGEFLTTKVLVCLLQFFSTCSATERTMKVLRADGHIQFLLCEVVPALCAFNDEDQELWISEPDEYIRRGYVWSSSGASPRLAALNLLVEFARYYKKASFKAMWPFWGQHLEAYRTGAAPNHRLKEGILLMMSCIEAELKNFKTYRTKIEAILEAYVLPDFTPSPEAPYLQARAIDMFANYCDIPWRKPETISTATKHIIGCLNADRPRPVQFQAAKSFVLLLQSENEHVFAAVEENVSSIVTNLIRLMNALAIDDVVKAMDHLIAHFGVHMLDYLQPLAEQLVVLYNKNVEAEDEEDNDGMDGMGMMAAENCVSTLGTLVQITTLRPKLYAPLEATVMPLLAKIYDVEEEDVNMMPLACQLLQTLAFHSPVPFSENLWRAFVAMFKAYDGFGFDFLSDCVNASECFVTRDKAKFLAGNPAAGENYLLMAWKIVAKPLAHGNEDDVAVALRLVTHILLAHPGQVDLLVDMCIKEILVKYWVTKPTQNRDLKVMLANILDACFLYNASRVLGLLASAGVLAPVLAGWFDALPLIITDTSNKLAGAGICALLRLGPSALPAALSGNLTALLQAALLRLRKLHPNEDEDTDDDTDDEEDSDDEVDSELEDDDKAVESDEEAPVPATAEEAEFQKRFDEIAEKSRARYAAAAKAAEEEEAAYAEGGADGGDDDEEEEDSDEEDDSSHATPFDFLNELLFFADTMKMYGAIPQGAAMHAGLPDPLKKTMTRLLTLAEAQRTALANEIAEMGGGPAAMQAACGSVYSAIAAGAGAGAGAGGV